ncbi:MAG TPA: sugar ABC transporter permease [Anaerolineae bacterium]|nr:sugar ABC transporter permease [Anaerolineae bacterium]
MRSKSFRFALIAPALLVILGTTIYPLVYSLLVSFQRWNLTKSTEPGPFVALENYVRAFGDKNFVNSGVVTVKFTVISVSMSIVLGLVIALILNRPGRLADLMKTLLIFPFAMAPALKGFTWRFLLDGSFGFLDRIIDTLFPPMANIAWLASPNWALFWLAVTEVWGWAPYIALVFIGALGTMSTEMVDAAKVDGANSLQLLWHIILPTLTPILLVITLFKTIYSLKMFDQVVTMTGGGPGRATETLNFTVYRTAFANFDMGYASAQAYILVIVQLLFAVFYVRSLLGKGGAK